VPPSMAASAEHLEISGPEKMEEQRGKADGDGDARRDASIDNDSAAENGKDASADDDDNKAAGTRAGAEAGAGAGGSSDEVPSRPRPMAEAEVAEVLLEMDQCKLGMEKLELAARKLEGRSLSCADGGRFVKVMPTGSLQRKMVLQVLRGRLIDVDDHVEEVVQPLSAAVRKELSALLRAPPAASDPVAAAAAAAAGSGGGTSAEGSNSGSAAATSTTAAAKAELGVGRTGHVPPSRFARQVQVSSKARSFQDRLHERLAAAAVSPPPVQTEVDGGTESRSNSHAYPGSNSNNDNDNITSNNNNNNSSSSPADGSSQGVSPTAAWRERRRGPTSSTARRPGDAPPTWSALMSMLSPTAEGEDTDATVSVVSKWRERRRGKGPTNGEHSHPVTSLERTDSATTTPTSSRAAAALSKIEVPKAATAAATATAPAAEVKKIEVPKTAAATTAAAGTGAEVKKIEVPKMAAVATSSPIAVKKIEVAKPAAVRAFEVTPIPVKRDDYEVLQGALQEKQRQSAAGVEPIWVPKATPDIAGPSAPAVASAAATATTATSGTTTTITSTSATHSALQSAGSILVSGNNHNTTNNSNSNNSSNNNNNNTSNKNGFPAGRLGSNAKHAQVGEDVWASTERIRDHVLTEFISDQLYEDLAGLFSALDVKPLPEKPQGIPLPCWMGLETFSTASEESC